MIEDIKIMINLRGLRNSVHSDRQPIIAAYATEFASHSTEVIRESTSIFLQDMREFFDTVFEDNMPEISKSAATRLCSKMKKEEVKARRDMNTAIESFECYNTHSDLIFSPNEHYLNELIARMVADETKMASNDGGILHILHNVYAYIKVPKKFVSELAAKELVRVLVLGNEEGCRRILLTESTKLVELVNEPVKISRERKHLLLRKTVLEDALAHVDV